MSLGIGRQLILCSSFRYPDFEAHWLANGRSGSWRGSSEFQDVLLFETRPPKFLSVTERGTILDLYNLSIHVSELHKIRQSTEPRTQKLRKCRSGPRHLASSMQKCSIMHFMVCRKESLLNRLVSDWAGVFAARLLMACCNPSIYCNGRVKWFTFRLQHYT